MEGKLMQRQTPCIVLWLAIAALPGILLFSPLNAAAKKGKKAEGEGWISLIHGETLEESGWKVAHPPDAKHKNGWSLKDGVLANKAPSIDLVSEPKFKDFDLHVEFNVPKGSNSGVYLRGCYEIQVEDSLGKKTDPHICGAVYGQKEPKENVSLAAGEWQTFDIVLADNRVTVAQNGKTVIKEFELKKPTGGALPDCKHGEAGPIMLQGDHGDVQYRNIRVRPAGAKQKQAEPKE
jgi:hypothetical protein